MAENQWTVVIGRVVGTFGLKGEVKIYVTTDEPEYFETLKEFKAAGPGLAPRILKLESVRPGRGNLVAKFQGIDSIDNAEPLIGAQISIRESDLRPLEEDEYLVQDIMGMEVVTTDGRSLGKINQIIHAPANDVYVTEQAMIPAVKEFVQNIDIKKKKMVVRYVEGMEQ
ncbi:MAG: ribosome maturation factor RimM [Armatimonadota bacterium]|jgi:16S rRNA processing protein RimM|nr:16S rRNA processing protein RimM [Armatimonadota bacterium]